MKILQQIGDFIRWDIVGRLQGKNKDVVCAVIVYGDKILAQTAQRNKSIHTDDSQFVVPGGKVEPHETLNAAVHREVKEETNLNIDVIKKLGSNRNQQYKLHWFACAPTDVSLLRVVEPLKQKELKWVSIDDSSINWTPKNTEALDRFRAEIHRIQKELQAEA